MFYTVFSTDFAQDKQWLADLLAYSWKRVDQDGALVRLVATDNPGSLPVTKHATCVASAPTDMGAACSRPASLLEWVYRDKPEGTVLLLDSDCVFRSSVPQRAAPGFPVAPRWRDLKLDDPRPESPFGLGEEFSFLSEHCASVELRLSPVIGPTLIHTRDLRKVSARWFELCRLMHGHFGDDASRLEGPIDALSYNVACAEYGLQHEPELLGVEIDACTTADTPILWLNRPTVGRDGRIMFDKGTYQPWSRIDPTMQTNHNRDVVALINEYVDQLVPDGVDAPETSRPKRCEEIMEGRVLDQLLLERQADGAKLWLNSSGKAIWELCEGSQTIEEIAKQLGGRFSADHQTILPEARAIIGQLQAIAFLELK